MYIRGGGYADGDSHIEGARSSTVCGAALTLSLCPMHPFEHRAAVSP